MTDSLFEVISEEEFTADTSVGVEKANSRSTGTGKVYPHELDLEWCEFCKGYYYAEYHYGRTEVGGGE